MTTVEIIPDMVGAKESSAVNAQINRIVKRENAFAAGIPLVLVTYEQKIQNALQNAGYYDGPIDGNIYDDTREAIKSFQRNNGLKSDGIVGRKTWRLLKKYYYNPDDE